MKIVDFIINLVTNHHFFNLDVSNIKNDVEVSLTIAIIYTVLVFLGGLLGKFMHDEKVKILYIFLQIIYCIVNTLILSFVWLSLTMLLGNFGFGSFMILWFIIYVGYGLWRLLDNNSMYVFNLGSIPEWVCENYEKKHNYYSDLNKDYKNFKQYNEDLI